MNAKILSYHGLLLMILCSCSAGPDPLHVRLAIEPAGYMSGEVPCHVDIELPRRFEKIGPEEIKISMQAAGDMKEEISGQLIRTREGTFQLWWIVPETFADRTQYWTAVLSGQQERDSSSFHWKDSPGRHLDLYLGDRKLFRYCYEMDERFEKGTTLSARNKPFYHIFDLEGKRLITNGPEEGLWPHQRGIMIGWRDLSFQGNQWSFWGMEDLTLQQHIEFLDRVTGPVLAQFSALIHWKDSTGTTVLEEVRRAVIYRQPPPVILLLDFISELRAINGSVNLDGNAEHGGVQYRAHSDVAEKIAGTCKPEYFFNRDGVDPRSDYNLPWVGMSYGLRDQIYSVLYMDHPENPRPSIWSAYRDYGRFGPFFRTQLDPGDSLTLQYRFWISEQRMPKRDTLTSWASAYRTLPEVWIMEQ